MTYGFVGEDYANFLDSAAKLVECDGALVLDVEEFESFLKEHGMLSRRRAFLLELLSQVGFKSE